MNNRHGLDLSVSLFYHCYRRLYCSGIVFIFTYYTYISMVVWLVVAVAVVVLTRGPMGASFTMR
jgi:hypothetical protein